MIPSLLETKKRKGVIEFISEYIHVIVAILVCLFILYIVSEYQKFQDLQEKDYCYNDVKEASEAIAKLAMSCWEKNNYGSNKRSEVCYSINLNLTERIYERNITDFLDCEFLPNNNCTPSDCSWCISKYYEDDDKILFNVSKEKTTIAIVYDANLRKIKIFETQ